MEIKEEIVEIDFNKKHGNGRRVTKNVKIDDFDNAKVLIDKNIIVIDIDNLEKSTCIEIVDYFNIKTQYRITNRGIHLYFKKPKNFKSKSESVCGLGFQVEYKTKEVVIKQDGVSRETYNAGNYEELPRYFYPVKSESVLNLCDGDGRYMKMFKLNLNLLKNGEKNISKVMNFINDFILGEPLEQKKLKQAQQVKDSEVIKSLETETDMAQYIMKKYNTVMYNKNIYVKFTSDYIFDAMELRGYLYEVFNNVKTRAIDEILKQLAYRNGHNQITEEIETVKLQNGILTQGQFIEVEYEDFTPFSLKISYVESDKNKYVDKFMELLSGGNPKFEDYLYEIVAQSLMLDFNRRKANPRFHLLYGEGGEGKTSFVSFINKIFGKPNTATIKPTQFAHNANVHSLGGKMVNVGDDVQDEALKPDILHNIKNIASCDEISIRANYGDTENMVRVFSNIIFTTNYILTPWEKGDNIKRRMFYIILPTDLKHYKKQNPEQFGDMMSNLHDKPQLEYFFHKVVQAYFRLYNNGYTYVNSIEEFNEEYHSENDNLGMYIEDLEINDVLDVTPKLAYQDYVSWCEYNDLHPSSKKRFQNKIITTFALKISNIREDGKRIRKYRKVEK